MSTPAVKNWVRREVEGLTYYHQKEEREILQAFADADEPEKLHEAVVNLTHYLNSTRGKPSPTTPDELEPLTMLFLDTNTVVLEDTLLHMAGAGWYRNRLYVDHEANTARTLHAWLTRFPNPTSDIAESVLEHPAVSSQTLHLFMVNLRRKMDATDYYDYPVFSQFQHRSDLLPETTALVRDTLRKRGNR